MKWHRLEREQPPQCSFIRVCRVMPCDIHPWVGVGLAMSACHWSPALWFRSRAAYFSVMTSPARNTTALHARVQTHAPVPSPCAHAPPCRVYVPRAQGHAKALHATPHNDNGRIGVVGEIRSEAHIRAFLHTNALVFLYARLCPHTPTPAHIPHKHAHVLAPNAVSMVGSGGVGKYA